MFKIIFVSFFMTSIAFANETTHNVGIEYGYSEIKNNTSEMTSELNDSFTSHYSISYKHKVSENISIGLSYLKGDSSKAEGIFADLFTDSKIKYNAALFSATANYPISKKNYLYVEVSALKYNYDAIDDDKVFYNENGNDVGFSFGWMYEFDNGIGIKAGYEALSFGEHIDIRGFNTGVSYRF